ncbi:MAG: DUF421 domain-containing protein [Oscillospiraceae bacterium]
MNILIFRTVLIYLLIIGAMRLMGKKQLGELQPSELVSTILISNLASISIESPELPLIGSIIPVFMIVAMEILVSGLCMRFKPISQLVSGSPKIVIRKGVADTDMLRELRFTADDLLEALRAKDVFDISDVEFAVVETNGSMSVYKTFAATNATNKSLGIMPSTAEGPSLPLIINGDIVEDNCKYYFKTEKWIVSKCKANGFRTDEVLLMLCNAADDVQIIKKESGK